MQAMERLSDEQREVVGLVLIEGLSYREAADIVGVPIGDHHQSTGPGPRGFADHARREQAGGHVTFSEDTLTAYVDGEVDAKTREQVEVAIRCVPDVARRVAAHQALRSTLRAGFAPVLEEPVPAHLALLVRSSAKGPQSAEVLAFRRKSPRRPAWVQLTSLAASFVLGIVVWHLAARLYPSELISESHGELTAAGALAKALRAQLASEQSPTAPVQVGISFRSKQGGYCRTFSLHEGSGAAGFACHEKDRWAVQVLARGDSTSPPQSQYRQAASALPATVLRAIDESIAGDPLDASAEAQARANGW